MYTATPVFGSATAAISGTARCVPQMVGAFPPPIAPVPWQAGMLSWVLQPPPLPPWVAQSVSADWQLHAVSVERRKGEPVGRRVVPPTQVTFGEVQGYCGVTVVQI